MIVPLRNAHFHGLNPRMCWALCQALSRYRLFYPPPTLCAAWSPLFLAMWGGLYWGSAAGLPLSPLLLDGDNGVKSRAHTALPWPLGAGVPRHTCALLCFSCQSHMGHSPQDISSGIHFQQTQPVTSNISFSRNKGNILSPLPLLICLTSQLVQNQIGKRDAFC